MKTVAALLVLAVAAVSALPTPEVNKESREGRTLIINAGGVRTAPVQLSPGMTLPSLQLPGLALPGLSVPAMTLPSLTIPQHAGLQIPPQVTQELLDGVARFVGAVVQNAFLS